MTTRAYRSGVQRHQAQADQATPVLAEEGDAAQVEPVEQRLAHPLDVPGVGVVGLLRGLVAAADADQVGRDHPVPGLDQAGDHVAVQEAPRGLAVHQQHRRGVGRALVDVGDAEGAAVAVVDLDVVRVERVTVEALEPIVGGAQCLHVVSPRRWCHVRPGTV
jgi:hypothetical protein